MCLLAFSLNYFRNLVNTFISENEPLRIRNMQVLMRSIQGENRYGGH
jgi:hypothetical protein